MYASSQTSMTHITLILVLRHVCCMADQYTLSVTSSKASNELLPSRSIENENRGRLHTDNTWPRGRSRAIPTYSGNPDRSGGRQRICRANDNCRYLCRATRLCSLEPASSAVHSRSQTEDSEMLSCSRALVSEEVVSEQ